MTLHDARPTTASSETRGRWSVALVERSARSREDTAALQLLAIFDVLDDLFRRGDRNARIFVEALGTIGRGQAVAAADRVIEDDFRLLVETLTRDTDLGEGDDLALSFRLLVNGAILKSLRGDHDASLRAKSMAGDLLHRHGFPRATGSTPAHPAPAGSWASLDLDSYAADRPSWP
ncbi:hypothetical protein [Frondihabitans sucicola]|uniref:hypothetical protein n=1 Tax=Frondihabitans sucicola TaxID=1268041 RepID=UPI002572394D|nr:hypothetical protein [Frondihabitans sucicola]